MAKNSPPKSNKPKRTRHFAEFTLVGDDQDGQRVELFTVKGTVPAKAVYQFAAQHLGDQYANLRMVVMSQRTF